MTELNNCNTCGLKPEIKPFRRFHYAECKCSKIVGPDVFTERNPWTAEVAADMWNRANPVEDGFEFMPEYINFLAGELASYRLHVTASENGLTIKETMASDAQTAKHIKALIEECQHHKQDLTDFYKNRLQTEARA